MTRQLISWTGAFVAVVSLTLASAAVEARQCHRRNQCCQQAGNCGYQSGCQQTAGCSSLASACCTPQSTCCTPQSTCGSAQPASGTMQPTAGDQVPPTPVGVAPAPAPAPGALISASPQYTRRPHLAGLKERCPMRPVLLLTSLTLALAAIGFAASDEPASPPPADKTNSRTAKAPAKSTVVKAADAKPAAKPAAKPGDKSADKSADQPGAKPAEKAASKAPAGPAADPGKNSAEEDAIRHTGETFAQAYNAGDAAAVAAHFTPDAEYVDEQGNVLQGRQAIEESLAGFFTENPGCQLEVTIDSIRFVSSGVAIEDGTTTVTRPAGGPSDYSRYTAVHVKTNGKWLTASSREHAPKSGRQHSAQLQQLEWMLGEWVDEDDDSIVEFSCQAVDNGNFLLRQFAVKIAGQEAMSGTQRIGWDPVSGKLRAWVFDSEGGYGEGTWHRDGESWVLKTTGVTADGQTASNTSIYTFVSEHIMTWQAVDHEIAGVQLPDSEVVTIVRKPPPVLLDDLPARN